MMARNHVATASALWFTAGVGAPALVGSSLTPAQMVSGGVVMATAGLLPDIDTETGTLRHAFGTPGLFVTRFVGRLAGGHRHATHTLAFALAAGGVGLLLGRSGLFLAVVLAASAHVAVRFLPRTVRQVLGTPGRWLLATVLAFMLIMHTDPGLWVGWALLVGVVAHLAGDVVTGSGVPLLWPVRRGRVHVPLVPIASRQENVAGWLLLAVAAVGAYVHLGADLTGAV